MIEPEGRNSRDHFGSNDTGAEIVIALGRLIYRSTRRAPHVLELDPTILWRVVFESHADHDVDDKLLLRCKDTSAWVMAVRTARLMRAVYLAGGFDEEPA